MKRFRVKAVGLGFVLAAGSVAAADGDWRAPGQAPAPAAVVQAGAPALLPRSVVGASAGVNAEPGPIWLPARAAEQRPVIARAAASGDPFPAAPVEQAVGPRPSEGGALGPLPAIPVAEGHFAPPTSDDPPAFEPPVVQPPSYEPPLALPAVAQPQPMPQQPDPQPAPKPVEEPKPPAAEPPPMPQPRPPEFFPPVGKGDPLPAPRPQPQVQMELEPAPAEILCPAGAVQPGGRHGKRGTFGSPPITLSRDIPPLSELIHNGYNRDITLAHDGYDGAGSAGGSLSSRYFLSGEYLLWWLPGFATPVLATTNANTSLNGYLGEPGTTSLVGPGSFINSSRSGFRVRGGAWLNDSHSCGIDGGFFFLGSRSNSAAFGSNQFPLITRPAFVPNLVPGTNAPLGENGEAVAVPGILDGTLTVQGASELWGADVNLRTCLFTGCNSRAEAFAGYRYLNLRESLTITENINVVGPGGARLNITDPIGTNVIVQDRFATRNSFNGGQVGALYERQFGRFDVTARGSVALGTTHQELTISGFQTRQRPGMPPMNFQGGLLAAGPNLGTFTKDRFSVVPELTLNLGYRVTDSVRVFAGYNFLLWTNVIRPGDQIDHVVDLTFVPNALPAGFSGQYRPRPLFTQRDLVINGIQFGADLRW